jgi:phosphatidylglycerol:prolipoprotein diacylglycerol transferase
LYVVLYCKKRRLPFFKYADIMMPFTALGHAFGRLGCLAAGCCFGRPSDLPWAIHFPYGSMAHQAQQNQHLVMLGDPALPVHPTQLYEAGIELLFFWLLVMMRPKKRFHGQLLLTWLALYPVARSIIEMFRGDQERGVYILSTSQYISIAVAGAAVALFLHFRRQRAAVAGESVVPT